jgi:hypothetical protein
MECKMQKFVRLLALFVLLCPVAFGCSKSGPKEAEFIRPPDTETEIEENLSRLRDPADRELAVEQRFCPIMRKTRLGALEKGPPIKLVLKGQTVFVCCTSCEEKAKADPDTVLAYLKEQKAKAKGAK